MEKPLTSEDRRAQGERSQAEAGDSQSDSEATAFGLRLAGRAPLVLAMFVLMMILVVARLAHWQLVGGQTSAQPVGPASRAVTAFGSDRVVHTAGPSRGRIVDRHGLLLATDSFVWDIYANPKAIQKDLTAPAVVSSLAQILAQPEEAIHAALTGDIQLVILAKEATPAQCGAVKELNQPILAWCDFRRVRTYPQATLAAHLIGMTNYDQQGIYGVEASYNDWLSSSGEWRAGRLPGAPQPLPEQGKLYLPSPLGRDLILHLDAALQYAVETRLAEAIAYYQAEAGTIIVLDPRSGGLLALANYPTFDLNHYLDVPQDLWVNPAVAQIYEPGSVFKVITMAAGLASGHITPKSSFQDEGYLVVSGKRIRNAERKIYGTVTAEEVLAKSINVVSAAISLKMGAETFYRYVGQFGFGKLTEIDLNQESTGIVKEPGNPLWSVFDQATNSFGQGISVTTLQMINAVAAIANRGELLQPQVVKALVKDGQVYLLPPRTLGRPIPAEVARTLTQMMVYTTDHSVYPNLVPGYRVAGKTGTAEIPTETGYTSAQTITSFIGFLPAADPQLVIMVKLVKPKRSTWAEHVAVPVLGQVAQDAVRILEIKPDNREP
jgi:cell division protein FtsI/penicillin-binding protein 2